MPDRERPRQQTMHFQRVDEVDHDNLLRRLMCRNTDTTPVDGLFQVRMRGRNGRCRQAQHRRDRKDHGSQPKRPGRVRYLTQHLLKKVSPLRGSLSVRQYRSRGMGDFH